MTIEKTFFVITYGRSGSTLIQNMMNKLPGFLIRGENNNILGPLIAIWYDLLHSEQRDRMIRAGLVPSTPTQPWYGYENIDPDAVGTSFAAMLTHHVLRPQPDTTHAGFKEIRWHDQPDLFLPTLDFLVRYMPDAHFIFNTRDHEAVRRSGWWKTMAKDAVTAELETAERLFKQAQATYPDRSISLRYEDLATSPEQWQAFMAFLDRPFDQGLVEEVLGQKLNHMKWVPKEQQSQ